MKQFIEMGVLETIDAIKNHEISAEELVKLYIAQIEKYKDKNAVLEVFDDAIENAKKIDEKIKNGEKVGKLVGVPIIIKDNILYKGHKATCASKFLKDFVSPYTSTVVQKLIDNDAIILGRANMDEFAMGSSTEHSAFGNCHNAFADDRVPGGSSGGSAVAVALNMCAASLGTDTGGSVRQPSSFNGVVGIKPTYGRISRYGIVAFASSLEQVGQITKNVKDNAYLLEILAGEDIHDQTSLRLPVDNYLNNIKGNINGLKIGLCKQLIDKYKTSENYAKFESLINSLKLAGAQILEVEIPKIELSLPVYYILATAEATSNLGRFDGVKYTTRTSTSQEITKLYAESRTAGFGDEVKRRIMMGSFVLSSGYFDAYYNKAKKVQRYITKAFANAFSDCDVLITPTTHGEAFKIGEKNTDPVSMYLEDMFTVVANISGIPAVSVPYSKGKNNLPLGVQVLANQLEECKMYTVANFIEKSCKEKSNA